MFDSGGRRSLLITTTCSVVSPVCGFNLLSTIKKKGKYGNVRFLKATANIQTAEVTQASPWTPSQLFSHGSFSGWRQKEQLELVEVSFPGPFDVKTAEKAEVAVILLNLFLLSPLPNKPNKKKKDRWSPGTGIGLKVILPVHNKEKDERIPPSSAQVACLSH